MIWDIFCAVVDNYGDIGVSWRLARQLAAEHGCRVRLWVDDLAALGRICPEVAPARASQRVGEIEVRHWRTPFPETEPAQVVIEAFGCELPPAYVAAMASRPRPPVWVNLEYLSAEDWVEGCHGLPSPHPRLPLVKYFFFPGFATGTGGLLLERGLLARRRAFQADDAGRAAFWRSLGLPPQADEWRISLFGYENTALAGLFSACSVSPRRIVCLLPEGRLSSGVAAWFGATGALAGDSFERGALRVHVLPFLEQSHYDRLLWACDCNFVRGEDSFVRAQWAARPFVWHIYPQDEDAHLVKLEAFLARYCAALPEAAAEGTRALWRAWNLGTDAGAAWAEFWRHREALTRHGEAWAAGLTKLGDLAANLVQFCHKRL